MLEEVLAQIENNDNFNDPNIKQQGPVLMTFLHASPNILKNISIDKG